MFRAMPGGEATEDAAAATVHDVLFVSHTHWDREWYRTFEAFRGHLVDAVDCVLDLLASDPGWRFHLDGQSIVVDDYLQVRPGRRTELEQAVRGGRLAVGPWYVQPDSLLPSGEAHVRNLLEGRNVAAGVGRCSTVAYTPDSFGHPSQFPQLFAGFGLGPFVFWRGLGDEVDTLGTVFRWCAPDGTAVTAYHLGRGYSCAAGLPDDPVAAASALVEVLEHLGTVERAPTVLMNGVDHMLPDEHTAAVARALRERTGRAVRRGLLDDLVDAVDPTDRPEYTGDLLGGRVANLLPGVWSSRMGLKLANRRAERALIGWAEPWAAIGRVFGLADERPALRCARRSLVANQAHDSIGGCSQDEVHRQMAARTATAVELADNTTARVLERLAGLGQQRRIPWSTDIDVAVFNATPRPRTDVVRVALDGFPAFRLSDAAQDIHPLVIAAGLVHGYTVDGRPARVVPTTDTGRMRVLDVWPELDVEFVAHDVPAFGWRRYRLVASPRGAGGDVDDTVDSGRTIAAGGVAVRADDDGTFTVTIGDRTFSGLAALEDAGDRGDTYDFDPVADDAGGRVTGVRCTRERHPSGVHSLRVSRTIEVPASLADSRDRRRPERAEVRVEVTARVVPGVERVDLHVEIDNGADDHRLRMLFPTGTPISHARAATTFGVARRAVEAPDATQWKHPAPRTFPHQGWVAANGLCVGAPGLPEAEVTDDGVIAITLLRCVGWLARLDLRSRPVPAGPSLPTPDAQCRGTTAMDLTLHRDGDGFPEYDEIGLRAVPAGSAPLLEPAVSLLTLAPDALRLSCLKPAEEGEAIVIRVLNPTGEAHEAVVRIGFPFASATSVRLDETPDGLALHVDNDARPRRLRFPVGAHALRTVRVELGA